MNKEILNIKNISKHFIVELNNLGLTKKIQAVDDVSFAIRENESIGLIGESGSGKSTIANMALKLIDPSSGKIELFTHDITHYDEKSMRQFRKDIQIIFQHSSDVLDPHMTIDTLIKEPLKIHRIVKESEMDNEVSRLLKLVGLAPSEKMKFPSQMSGGQKQRIIIARAIATRPKLIVCDEPVSALDVSVQGQILNLLVDLKHKLNLTYLFISHDLKVVEFICEKICVMYKGKIIEQGVASDVLKNPRHAHTEDLVRGLL